MLLTFFSIVIVCSLIYLFYLYLKWCSSMSTHKFNYDFPMTKMLVSKANREILEKYGKFMLPEYLSDTFKPIRFNLLYFKAKYF